MGRTEMEREFRHKLQAREIAPSAQSWDRLDAMLSVAETKKQKPKRRIGWIYYAAASIVAVLLAAFLMTRGDNPSATVQQVAEAPSEPQSIPGVEPEMVRPVQESKVAPPPNLDPKTRDAIAAVGAQTQKQSPSGIKIEPDKQDAAPIIEPTSGLEIAVSPKHGVDVDQVLASAPQQNLPADNRVKVNPRSLLSQVDGEIELTFREKMIRTVSKNYRSVHLALANRNQE